MTTDDHAESRARLARTIPAFIAPAGMTGVFLLIAGCGAFLWIDGARTQLQVDPGAVPWAVMSIAVGAGTLLVPVLVFWLLRRRGLPSVRAWLAALGLGLVSAVVAGVLRVMFGGGF
jgi:hypothetical protein